MIYKEYQERRNRLRAAGEALDRQFISEYKYKDLIGKPVMVCYRFRGKLRLEKHFFAGLAAMYHDIVPEFYYLRRDGSPSSTHVGIIYSVKQIQEIIPIEENGNNG